MSRPLVAPLFPVGGPVPANLIIGREDEVDELVGRVAQGASTLVAGPRRIGKTTVCQEVCRRLGDGHDMLVIKVDVPERIQSSSTSLLQEIIDACSALRVRDSASGALRILRPTIERWLESHGIPMDLSGIGRRQPVTMREVIELPLRIAEEQGQRVVLFFDELQRAVDYVDGNDVLTEIRDVYSAARNDVVVLVDGSSERTIEHLLQGPYDFRKLVGRYDLPTTIPAYRWNNPLVERFRAIGKELANNERDSIIGFGSGRPYDTMAAARFTALAAAKHDSNDVLGFDLSVGLDQAREHLRDHG